MRALAALLLALTTGCIGTAGEVVDARSEPVGPDASLSDAGLADDSDAGLADAGTTPDAGTDAGTAADAGSSTPDAGLTVPDAGFAFDGGGFPLSDGPLHGAIPTVTEGPINLQPTQSPFDDTCAVTWNPLAHELLFTVCQVNHVWRYRPNVTANAGFDIVRMGGQGVFGMQGLAVLPDGALVVAETVQHQLTISRSGYANPQPWITGDFNMPLHVVARRDGNVYFTDPRTESGGGTAPLTALFRVAPDGQVTTHLENLGARGLALSFDQRKLYVSAENRYGETILYVVALDESGAIGTHTIFAAAPGAGMGAFGLCVDQADNVYHAARSGVRVHSPTGAIISTINVPGADDCSFGEDDARAIYVTTASSLAVHNLYRFRVDVPGLY